MSITEGLTSLKVDKEHFDQKVVGVSLFIFIVILYLYFISISDQFWTSTLNSILYFYFSVSLLRFAFHTVGYFLDKRLTYLNNLEFSQKRLEDTKNFIRPKVSILIPAYNEEKSIVKVLKSFRYFNDPNFEVVLVDDGSLDQTYKLAQDFLTTSTYNLKVVTQKNAGKSSALNTAFDHSSGDFVICMDADSTLKINQLEKIILKMMNDPQIGAIAGVVKITGQKKLISKFQNLDYLIGHFQRKTLSLLGKVTVIPGPIGLFRREALISVNGYERENKTFAEDAELTLRLISRGWKIQSSDDLIAFTEGPQNIQELIRQRYRWSRGLYQAFFKNFKSLLCSADDKNIIMLIYLIWEQILNPMIDFSVLFLIAIYFVFGGHFEISLVFIFALLLIDTVIAMMATSKESNRISWLGVSLISRLSYSNLLLVWKVLALYDEVKNKSMSWDSLERRGDIYLQDEGAAV